MELRPTKPRTGELPGQHPYEAVSGVMDEDEEELSRFSEPLLAALARDLDTPQAIKELKKLANHRDSSARRVLRTLSNSILGLSLTPYLRP